MTRSAFRTAAVAALFLLPLAAQAAMKLDGKPKVSFFATGSPGFLDIEGVASQVTAADDGTKLTFTVPMSSVSTGIDLRDDHMNNEFVQIAQFPNAVLSFDKASVQWPAATGQRTNGTVKGEFTVHGVPQPVDVTYTNAKTKTGFRVQAKFDFDVSKHSIAIPSYLGVTVDPKMHAEATLDLVDAP